jgi:hypothetical protein
MIDRYTTGVFLDPCHFSFERKGDVSLAFKDYKDTFGSAVTCIRLIKK